MRGCRLHRAVVLLAVVLAGNARGMVMPARAQPTGSTTASATYKGLTTTREYLPLPDTRAATVTKPAAVRAEPINESLRQGYRINRFYTKALTIKGIVVMGSDKVSDWAFLEAAYTLDHMLHESPPWVHDALTKNKVRLAILAVVEYTMDLPENQTPNMQREAAYNDRRSRGLGGMPWCSCAEENLLNLRGDPYGGNGRQGSGENITIHEFSHTVASAIQRAQGRNGTFWTGLRKAYQDSLAAGGRLETWNRQHNSKVYASVDEQEFWAEGAQAWFDNANPRNSGGLSVRADVKSKEPALAALLTDVYGDGSWRYIKTTAKDREGAYLRPTAEMEHLQGLESVRGDFPLFRFENSPRIKETGSRGDENTTPR